MTFSKASPAERAALVRMVSASAKLIAIIASSVTAINLGGGAIALSAIQGASEEFVDAIIEVQESESEAVRESYQ